MEEKENRQARKRALADVKRIKKYLVNEIGVKEIYLFGSIVRKDFKKDSDIDIGISGFDEKKFFSIWCKLDELTDFNVELVDLDEKDDFFRQQIRKIGKRIYGSGQ